MQQSMADLQSEVKAMRSELQLMRDERRQYGGGQGRQGKGSPRPTTSNGDPTFTEEGTPICFKCRKPGHMRRNCPEKRGNTTKQNEVTTGNDQASEMGVALRQ
ncbi:hypothetical protein HOLleu_32814 [Holothuria leucospilota]|uniref:CCHC-type domain-containing protein n=1 Tax=Holothuria leucospilota TaxID=206669 RepID=A0A9Q1BJA0_HOLLE|nr:hypothetical protein HOLleu_32814 [Holothuria leucospilota]